MKKIILTALIMAAFSACIIYVPQPEGNTYPGPYEEEYGSPVRGAEMSEVYFYDYLGRYGVWVNMPPHGYVWLPRDVDYGWRPYTRGRWAWTDYGWTWVSRYNWGWIPFHYGRWGWDNQVGWYWVVGYTWGPAWVTWRRGNRYIGWAPLPPDVRFMPGYGIHRISYDIPSSYWIFVEGRHFYNDRMYRYILPPERNHRIIRTTVSKTEIIQRNNRIINRGVDVDEIRRMTGDSITKYQLEDAPDLHSSRLEGNKIRISRPEIQRDSLARPAKVMKKEEAGDVVTSDRIRKTRQSDELEERQERERELLEKTQEQEVSELKEKLEKSEQVKEQEKTQTETERREKVEELQKQHQAEKSELKKRQSEEAQKVKKSSSTEKKKEEEKKEKTSTTKKKKKK
jgi:hypothetical protein